MPEGDNSLSAGDPLTGNRFAVVAIGASAGGLDATGKLLNALSANPGMAFILVQHLEPNHESMMAELLASHTSMNVLQAADGMRIETDHLYVIPPGVYLLVTQCALRLIPPTARHGSRLPFDYLLHSLAEEFGPRAVCLILSGTGKDGSLGLASVHDKSGLVIAQDPREATFDGMPLSAIETGCVDAVLAIADMPLALAAYGDRLVSTTVPRGPDDESARLRDIIDLLRVETAHDFTLYKHGTLHRRIERRMALAGVPASDKARYLELLRGDHDELDKLATDLLINVTSFFRDKKVFEVLEKSIIPEMIRGHTAEQPLRIWIAGCSTGEEAYSLAMLFQEHLAAENPRIELQVFASDVDPEAIATAREGFYAATIANEIPTERLTHFFSKEDHGYRVSSALRAAVVFTVQDVLVDPPFSRLDLVSCRNLLIYLGAEAQAKAIAIFHFALLQGGVLLLGSAETTSNNDRFEVISKTERLYRSIGRSHLRNLGKTRSLAETGRLSPRSGETQASSRQSALADLCRRVVLESYAPAAVLINAKHECLFSLGPIHQYLRVAQGHPTNDLLAMATGGVRTKLRSAIYQANERRELIVVPGGHLDRDSGAISFDISAKPLALDGEQLLLICFLDGKLQKSAIQDAGAPRDVARVNELEHELEATRTELQGAIHNLEIASEEQKAINEEALSANEEFQSTNEELLTSKEELQSLNEELTALNSQLQETLDRQRTTATDLQNILYSTDVATLFLDMQLNIRFFTPATRSLFNVIPGDVGRPLADLNSLSADRALADDARSVLVNLTPIEREIETQSDTWFTRRILPYRSHDNKVEGVVITFTDISERKATRKALELAKQDADLATIAKSRFLASASHDLRQPLQTLTLLQALLARLVEGEKAPKLVARLGETLEAMAGMLNTLLDINQIEAGVVRAEPIRFRIDELLDRIRNEFGYHAQAQQIALRGVPCSLEVYSDPQLLEQMIRNLLSNALKYTKHGKILLGCRRRRGAISIEIWDTGIGIPEGDLQSIFEEYHQLDNAARERTRGLGLGLSIVQRLSRLLGHRIAVRSQLGRGSMFAIEVTVPVDPILTPVGPVALVRSVPQTDPRRGTIVVVEDDPDVRELAEMLLTGEGYRVMAASDGYAALELVAKERANPDLILADYNLPRGMHGLQVTEKFREVLGRRIPVIIMTGDISTSTMREIKAQNCLQLNKPVRPKDMIQAIQRLLAATPPLMKASTESKTRATVEVEATDTIHVVDDDAGIRESLRALLEDAGYAVALYPTSERFLASYQAGRGGCLLIDAYLPGMSGIELLRQLRDAGDLLPAIMITGNSDVPMAVEAMKVGASDFIEKPVGAPDLFASVTRALEQSRDTGKTNAWREDAARQIAGLTHRQREIMVLVLAGHPNKNIAADLGISQRTVENHRALIMKKTGSKSLPALARLALTADASHK